MHEQARQALGQESALGELTREIGRHWPGAVAINGDVLEKRFFKRAVIRGWTLPAAAIDSPEDLLLLVPDEFPSALPLVALSNPPAPPPWLPHIEVDGVACLSTALMQLPVDFRHVLHVVQEAVELIKDGLTGSNRDDFLEEVSSYWTLRQPPSDPIWYLLTKPRGTAQARALQVRDAAVVSESQSAATEWVANVFPRTAKPATRDAAIVRLPRPMYPENYPSNSDELLSLLSEAGDDALNLVLDVLAKGKELPLLLTFEHNGRLQLVGAHVSGSGRLGHGHGSMPLHHGFRKGHIPRNVLAQRLSQARLPVLRADAVRVDSDFLLQRTTGRVAATLADLGVAVFGCGALGGAVIQLLAQAGIKHLTLVDPDCLSWQNLGRHILSSRHVAHNKATAMKDEVLSRFGDYDVVSHEKRWQEVWKEDPGAFDKRDLVISLTADWRSDSQLNELSKTGDAMPPVIFSWLEAHGLAGHVVTVLPEGGCLRCLTSPLGEFLYHVTVVPREDALQREAGCGAFYQPFSAASVAPLAAQVVKAALDALSGRTQASAHTVWVGAREDFDAAGATVTPRWAEVLTEQGYERVYRNRLESADDCPVCRRIA